VRDLLVLWDLDYTLLDAGGSGRAVYRSVFRDLFGRDPDQVAPMGGRTERAIIADTLAMAGINDPARHVDAFIAELTRRAPELQATIAARQPFLDFVFSRVNADGSKQKFQVSGEPMFSQSCRFIGYRGIGVELIARKAGDALTA